MEPTTLVFLLFLGLAHSPVTAAAAAENLVPTSRTNIKNFGSFSVSEKEAFCLQARGLTERSADQHQLIKYEVVTQRASPANQRPDGSVEVEFRCWLREGQPCFPQPTDPTSKDFITASLITDDRVYAQQKRASDERRRLSITADLGPIMNLLTHIKQDPAWIHQNHLYPTYMTPCMVSKSFMECDFEYDLVKEEKYQEFLKHSEDELEREEARRLRDYSDPQADQEFKEASQRRMDRLHGLACNSGKCVNGKCGPVSDCYPKPNKPGRTAEVTCTVEPMDKPYKLTAKESQRRTGNGSGRLLGSRGMGSLLLLILSIPLRMLPG